MLTGFSLFFVFAGVLIVMMASSQAGKDKIGRVIPPERAQILALVLLVIGVGLFAYILYGKAFG
jgi:uncharacterized membrane protein YidH (DUF202 family)